VFRQTHHGYPGSHVSPNAASVAPLPAALMISSHAFSVEVSRLKKFGAAWMAASVNSGKFVIKYPPLFVVQPINNYAAFSARYHQISNYMDFNNIYFISL
jgi:hypothetical protein